MVVVDLAAMRALESMIMMTMFDLRDRVQICTRSCSACVLSTMHYRTKFYAPHCGDAVRELVT